MKLGPEPPWLFAWTVYGMLWLCMIGSDDGSIGFVVAAAAWLSFCVIPKPKT